MAHNSIVSLYKRPLDPSEITQSQEADHLQASESNPQSSHPLSLTDVERSDKKAANSFFLSLVQTGLSLCIFDVVFILASTLLVALGAYAVTGILPASVPKLLFCLAAACPFVFYAYGLYPGISLNVASELQLLTKASSLLMTIFVMATVLYGYAPGRNTLILLFAYPVWLIGLPLSRRLARKFLAKKNWWGIKTIVFGQNLDDKIFYDFLKNHPEQGLLPVGYIDVLHSPETLQQIANDQDVHHAVVIEPRSSMKENLRLLSDGIHGFLQITVIPSRDVPLALGVKMVDVGKNTLGFTCQQRLLMPENRFFKRLLDLVLIALCVPLLLPLTIAIMLMIKLTSPGPVFYASRRIGKNGKSFFAWKFRTMQQNADQLLEKYLESNPEMRAEWEEDQKLKNDPRVIKVGHFLRKTSLDELPQLWNVVLGEMSLVGPRPILPDEVSNYSDVFYLYRRVLPGITGLWQVSGRNNTSYEERLVLVTCYIRNWSIWLDICILTRTIIVVLKCDGAY